MIGGAKQRYHLSLSLLGNRKDKGKAAVGTYNWEQIFGYLHSRTQCVKISRKSIVDILRKGYAKVFEKNS